MITKLINQTRYCCVTLLSVLFVVITGFVITNSTHQPFGYIFAYHMNITVQQQLQEALTATLEANEGHVSAAMVHETIKQIYPHLQEIQISTLHHPSTKTIIAVKQEKPYLVINDVVIMTEHEHQAPTSAYQPQLYEGAIHVRSHSFDPKDLHDLYQFISKLPAELLQEYSAVWHNQTLIELHHNTQPYNIKASATTIFDNSVLQAVAAVISYTKTKKELSKNRNTQWVMNVRCKNQIILAVTKGGNLT